MKIGGKIYATTIGSMACAIAIICTSIFLTEAKTKHNVINSLSQKTDKITENQLSNVANDFYTMCTLQQGLLQKILQGSLNYAEDFAALNGSFKEGKKAISWQAVNQFTKDKSSLKLPEMLIGNTWLGQNSSFDKPSFLVDDVIDKFGVTCTIFQRMNSAGDMLRVCTNIKKLDGSRAIGTYIPAKNTDGTPNSVIAKIIAGETYFARAYVVNAWYITIYKPIKDSTGKIIGVLYVGIRQDTATEFKNAINRFSLPNNGYAFVINGDKSREFSGKIIYHKDDDKLGKNLLNPDDPNTNNIIRQLLEKTATAGDGKSISATGFTENSQTGMKHEIIASAIYFEPFDWLIAIVSDKHDFSDITGVVSNSLEELTWVVILTGLAVLILSTVIAVFIVRGIIKPITLAVTIAKAIAQGEITLRMNHKSSDETGELSAAFDSMLDHFERNAKATRRIADGDLNQTIHIASNKDILGRSLAGMLDNLNEVLGQTKSAAEHTSNAASEINSASSSLSNNTQSSIANLDSVCDQLEDMDNHARSAAKIAAQTESFTSEAVEAAKLGNSGMQEMMTAMNDIQESSDAITKIIKTIDDLAFQTNLLALNAAVESARAGQHGKGFAVVADEVRNLAARSAKSASETSSLVLESKNKVELGVRIASHTRDDLEKINTSINQVIDLIQTLSAESSDQSVKIETVNNEMQLLREVVLSNTAAAEETSATAVELASQAKDLEELLSHFNIRENLPKNY